MTANDDPQMIRRAAMDLLARREHSHAELQRKLARRFGDSEVIEAALEQLAGENLQSDERYAESFARQRIQRGYGPQRLRQEMRQKGLDEGEVLRALASLEVDWRALAAEVYHKKFGDGEPQDLRDKGRRLRFMQYRGFSPDQFSHLIE